MSALEKHYFELRKELTKKMLRAVSTKELVKKLKETNKLSLIEKKVSASKRRAKTKASA